MPKMDNSTLRAILTSENIAALGTSRGSAKLTADRARALNYYFGDMDDMPTIAGRSAAISTDVSDVVEGIMPMLMDIFVGGDDVVQFIPFGPEDEQAAQQETDYVNWYFMQKNQGFMTLEAGIKDALIQKNGIFKVWWEPKEEYEKEEYKNLSEDALAILKADPEIEIVEEEEVVEFDAGAT